MTNLSKTIAILGVVAGLGVAALPLSSYAAESTNGNPVSEDATVTLTIAKKLSITLDENTADLGAGEKEPAINVTVVTNNTHGYNLNIKGSTTAAEGETLPTGADATSLVSDNGVDFIPAGTLADGASSWGYKVAQGANGGTIATGLDSWTAVTVAGKDIMSSNGATKNAGETATVTFGAKVADGQAAGTYTGKVTFTASDKTE